MHKTTGDFIAAGDTMEIRCRKCRRMVWVGGQLITKMFPASTPIDQARRRLKCKCGAKMPTVTVKAPHRYSLPYDAKTAGR